MNGKELTGRDLSHLLTETLGIQTEWPMGWNEPRMIPRLFDEIVARMPENSEISVGHLPDGTYTGVASPIGSVEAHEIHISYGSDPSEALIRLLLEVIQQSRKNNENTH